MRGRLSPQLTNWSLRNGCQSKENHIFKKHHSSRSPGTEAKQRPSKLLNQVKKYEKKQSRLTCSEKIKKCDLELDRGLLKQSLPPFSLSPPKVLWTPLTFLISCPFPERGEDRAGCREDCGIIHAFLSTFHPKMSLWKVFLFLKKVFPKTFLKPSLQGAGEAEKWTMTLFCWENCKKTIWKWK